MNKYNIDMINRGFIVIKSKIRNMELEAIKRLDLDVSDIQWNYLIWLCENQEVKISELAHQLGVQKGTLSNNIKYLESKNLISKTNNGRRILITPTEKGNEYIKLHKELHMKIKEELLSVLNEDELEQLIQVGIKLRDNL